tara:strand:- start:6602 stop:7642 length:1041 start_codon:yes stop_codon:yes gene_type:complete
MQHIHYFKNRKINQQIFNKKINWFFDIKSVIYGKYEKKTILNFANQISKDYYLISKIKNTKKNTLSRKINSHKLIIKNYSKNKKIIKIIKSIHNLKMNKYFKYFLIQGSIASRDYINGYSDFDTFVVIKNETLIDNKKILELRVKLNKLYKNIISFSKLQHHGLIIYTEYDLQNYLKGFLPVQALRKNSNLFKSEKIKFKLAVDKKENLSKKILVERKKFLENSIKFKTYNHHVKNKNNIPKIPFRSGDPFLFELFYQIGTMLNIPILFLDAIGKSSHKKKSFLKFYKIVNNNFVIDFIKKHENLRLNWKDYDSKNFKVSKKLIEYLGPNYINDCLKIYKIILSKL